MVDADVIVVGAGPGGSATAAHLARRGLDVVLLEKATFPRDKICGDGLTPRAVRALTKLGVDLSPENGFHRNLGLKVTGGSMTDMVMPWPQLADFPDFGLTSARMRLDETLARHAQKCGATLVEGAAVTDPILEGERIVGVRTRAGEEYRAPVVVAADGVSSRLGVKMGVHKLDDRPMGVAVRAYYRSPRGDLDHMESWLELWDGEPGASNVLPGYGWLFPLGDGVVNVGLGMLSTSEAFGTTDYKQLMRRWLASLPPEWGLNDENMIGEIRGAALPMGFDRKPAYAKGLLLVGDAGGMVNPFNGEGIDYALEAAELAADAIAEAHGPAVAVELDPCGGGLDLLFGAEAAPGWRWSDLRAAAGHVEGLAGRLPNVSGPDVLAHARNTLPSPRPRPRRGEAAGAVGVAVEPPGPEAVRAVVAALTRSHQLVVLDCGHAPVSVGEQWSSTRTLLVCGASVRAVVAARARMSALALTDTALVVRQGVGHPVDAEAVARALELPLVGVLHDDRTLPRGSTAGDPPGRARGRFRKDAARILEAVAA